MRTRSMLLAAAAVALLFCSDVRAEEWTKHWSVAGKPELRVWTGDASVMIEAGAGSEISAVVRTRGVSIGRSGIQITDHQDGNAVDLEIKEPPMHFSFGNHSVEVRIQVPKELTATIHTGDGSVKLHGLHGSMRVETGDGSIEGDALDGGLESRSGDGSLHLRGRFDNLRVRTSDGSVEVQAAAGSHLHSDWRVETGDGSVRLTVPRDLAADVQLATGDGSIHVDLPLTIEGTKTQHELRGKLNGGGPSLDVHTGDGSISLGSI
ncbi:MAG: DUF4097 family beta strand repeat protein [Acidobacteriaceae bacterium]|nr:DUF4097 family beta strand repeat protein [Acidobacteriaceae bacterium]